MTEIRKVNLDQVERGVEEALRTFAGRGADNGGEVLEIPAAERINKIGNMSALAIIEASETTAKDIEEAGQAAVNIANDISAARRRAKSEREEDERAPEGVRHARKQGEHCNAQYARRGIEPFRDIAEKLKKARGLDLPRHL